jgi:hypothetical protein
VTALRFSVYPAATPTGGLLATLTGSDYMKGTVLRQELNGTGSGRCVIHGDHASVTSSIFARGNYFMADDTDNGTTKTITTSLAADDKIDTTAAHGFAVNDRVEFTALTGGTGLSLTIYWVIAVPSSTEFQVSTSKGGTAVNFSTNITAGTVVRLEDVGGFFLTEGDFPAVSREEAGGRVLTFGGPGSLAYLSRAVMDSAPYVASGTGIYNGPRDDMLWHWGQHSGSTFDKIGAILKRIIDEAQDADRPTDPIPDLTYSFDNTNDSASDPWDMLDSGFTLSVGENYLDCIRTFMELGLTILMKPNLDFLAFQEEYGTDRSNGSYAANKVRFLGNSSTGNIVVGETGDLVRSIHDSARLSQLLVAGAGGVPADTVKVPDAGAAYDREGFLMFDHVGFMETDATLTAAGEAELAARRGEQDTIIFTHVPGDDEANGLYTPGWPGGNGHYWLGDTVRVHTGTGAYDFDEDDFRVAAISWILRDGGDWDIVVELGATYFSISSPNISGGGVGGGGCVCPHPPSGPYESGNPALLLPRLYPTGTSLGARKTPHAVWDTGYGDTAHYSLTTTQNAGSGRTINPSSFPEDSIFLHQFRYTLTGTVVFTGGSVRGQGIVKMRHGVGVGWNIGQSQMVVRLFDSSDVLKATLLAPHEPAGLDSTEWINEHDGGANPPYRNAMFPADSQWASALGAPLASATGVATDYLLIEVGLIGFNFSASGCNTSFENHFGTNDAADNNQTATQFPPAQNSWFEFWNAGGDSFAGDSPPPAAIDETGDLGDDVDCYALCDHRHPVQTAGVTPITDEGGYFTGTEVESALQELGAHVVDTSDAHDASAVSILDTGGYFTGTDVEAALQELGAGSGFDNAVGPILISDTPAGSPLVFADLLQTEAGDDLLYEEP